MKYITSSFLESNAKKEITLGSLANILENHY